MMLKELCRSSKGLMTSIILILCISCGYHFIDYNFHIEEVKNERATIVDRYNAIKWEVVKSIILTLNHEQEFYTQLVTHTFKTNLLNNYKSLDHLKFDLDTKNYADSSFGKLIMSTSTSEGMFGKYVTNRSGVFISCDDQVFYNLIKPSVKFNIPWEDFNLSQYNTELAFYTYEMIRNRNTDIKIIEPSAPPSDDKHYKIKKSTLNHIRDIYLKEGIDGLYSYILLYPCYITPNGDIFGSNDFNTHGVKIKNHKITVISYISLYDTIQMFHSNRLNNLEELETEALEENYEKMKDLYLSSIMTLLFHIIFIITGFILYRLYLNKNED